MKIPESRGEAKAPLRASETEKDRRIKGATTLWPHHLSTRPTQYHTKRVPLGLQFLQWEKESPRWTSPSVVAGFLRGPSGLTSTGSLGESVWLDHLGSDRDREEGQWYSHISKNLKGWNY